MVKRELGRNTLERGSLSQIERAGFFSLSYRTHFQRQLSSVLAAVMKRLQGPINPCLLGGEHLNVECFEQETSKTLGFSCYTPFVSTDRSLSFEKGEEEIRRSRLTSSSWSLEDKIPFLEMLQSVDSQPFFELSFQHDHNYKKPWDQSHTDNSYTPEVMECNGQDYPQNPQYYSTSYAADGGASPPECNQDQLKPLERQFCCGGEGNEASGTKRRECQLTSPAAVVNRREKRKRSKRTKPAAKKKEEVESQRMTHIAVERNRRRQMNDHLNALRSLIPSSYIQRGDQASIIGGAIDFVKELEQLFQSLQAHKRMRKSESSAVLDQGGAGSGGDTISSTSSSSSSSTATLNGMCEYENKSEGGGDCITDGIKRRRRSDDDELITAQKRSRAVDVKVMMVIQNHVNLKIECPNRKPGQLLKAIVALEDLRLTVLHLNITSLETSLVHYSFNLKIEDDCEVGSADGIAGAVHQIFSLIINNPHTLI